MNILFSQSMKPSLHNVPILSNVFIRKLNLWKKSNEHIKLSLSKSLFRAVSFTFITALKSSLLTTTKILSPKHVSKCRKSTKVVSFRPQASKSQNDVGLTIFSFHLFEQQISKICFFYSLKQWLVMILHSLVHMSQIQFCFNAFKAR